MKRLVYAVSITKETGSVSILGVNLLNTFHKGENAWYCKNL